VYGASGIKARQFQQSESPGIFFARGFVKHNYLGCTFLFNYATPQIGRSGALRTDLNLVGGLDNLHFCSPMGWWRAQLPCLRM
jgi:hypothetical protein